MKEPIADFYNKTLTELFDAVTKPELGIDTVSKVWKIMHGVDYRDYIISVFNPRHYK